MAQGQVLGYALARDDVRLHDYCNTSDARYEARERLCM